MLPKHLPTATRRKTHSRKTPGRKRPSTDVTPGQKAAIRRCQNGLPGDGRQQGNAFFNELPVMLITLEYRYGERSYTRTISRAVAYDSLHVIQPGDTRQAWIDVRNPRTVVF